MIFGFRPPPPARSIIVLPLIGMILFVILYVVATFYYPGGSWRWPNASGFSFWNNYLCDLLDHYAINGELNQARYIARTALGFLCGGLLLLWYYLPLLFGHKGINLSLMWVSGILALGTTFFLSSGTHDITVRIAGFFGIIAFISCFVELYRIRFIKLFYFGIACLTIFLVNYYVYETGTFIKGLPVIQKITFLCCIAWFVILNISLLRQLPEKV